MGVERIEMRPLPQRVRVLHAHPIRPIGGIGDQIFERRRVARQGGGIEDAAHVGGELRQTGDKGIVPRRRPGARERARPGPARPAQHLQAAQLRADEEKVDAAGDHAEVGVVQDHPAEGPVRRRPGVGDGERAGVAGELPRRGAAKETCDGAGGGGADVGAWECDAAAPGIAGAVDQEKRIEHHAQTARLQIADAAHHRGIRGRAAVDRGAAARRQRDEPRRACGQAGAAPGFGAPYAGAEGVRGGAAIIRRGIDRALRHIRRIAEPRHHQRHRGAAGIARLQLIDGDGVIGARAAGRGVEIDDHRRACAERRGAMRQRIIDPLARGREERDAVRIGHVPSGLRNLLRPRCAPLRTESLMAPRMALPLPWKNRLTSRLSIAETLKCVA